MSFVRTVNIKLMKTRNEIIFYFNSLNSSQEEDVYKALVKVDKDFSTIHQLLIRILDGASTLTDKTEIKIFFSLLARIKSKDLFADIINKIDSSLCDELALFKLINNDFGLFYIETHNPVYSGSNRTPIYGPCPGCKR